jgi:enoyl-CoA hydratase/carnithine racemase
MATTEHRSLRLERSGAATTVVLDRPERRNALSLELMQELTATLRELGEDQEVRAIVIAGAGPAFSAGHDLSEMVGRDAAFYDRLFQACVELMETIHRVPQPVIARVHGMATAAGCQLVAACDLAVAAERRLAASSPLTLRIGKEAFYRQVDLAEGDAYELTREVMARNAEAADAQEGMGAFLAKRPPTWTGR